MKIVDIAHEPSYSIFSSDKFWAKYEDGTWGLVPKSVWEAAGGKLESDLLREEFESMMNAKIAAAKKELDELKREESRCYNS